MGVVTFDGVVLGDVAVPCEVFGRVQGSDGRPAYEVRVCSARDEVESTHLAIKTPWRLASLARCDTVIVPGIEDVSGPMPDEVVRAILRASERGARIASICSGAFILAATGLLDGLRATTHWLGARRLQASYPDIEVDPDVLYVDHGHILTSAGAAAGMDLCIHIIRTDLGAEVAAHVARLSVMPLERAGGQAQFIDHPSPDADGESLTEVLGWIEQNLRSPLTLPVIAQRAAMSTRTLSRRFREQTGTTPAQWIIRARVRAARRLLETTSLSVEHVATNVGFGSSAVLRQRFAELVGTSPRAYRSAFGRA
ncbi:MAG: helix-turn-helix domain-containing protein [Deltaproteobacteria bacterium]